MFRLRFALISASALVVALPAASAAGPPLLCFPFHTGGAPSLPWDEGDGWNRPLATYPIDRLVPDTIRLLTPDAPVIARMETLRRATIYAHMTKAMTMLGEPDPAMELAAALATGNRGKSDEHYRRAQRAARNEVVAKNLVALRAQFGHSGAGSTFRFQATGE